MGSRDSLDIFGEQKSLKNFIFPPGEPPLLLKRPYLLWDPPRTLFSWYTNLILGISSILGHHLLASAVD